jgi:hypothetical protein
MSNSPFVILENGQMAVNALVAGIPKIALMTDGLTLIVFDDEKELYITLDNAIQWHETELQKNKEWRTDFIELLKEAKIKIQAGKVTIKA